ncbi:MAG: hypothetical protein WD066_15025, partial [Planctomycetaceae bacterium]
MIAPSVFMLLILAGDAALSESAQASAQFARRAVERAVPYIEQEGAGWWETHACITCHQMPIMFWSLDEARSRGVTIDGELLAGLRGKVVARLDERLAAGKKPHLVTDDVPLLIQGLTAGPIDERTARVLGRSVDQFLRLQRDDGSWIDPSLHWKEKKGGAEILDPYPPIIESDAVKTMWIVLAGERVKKEDPAWVHGRDRALAWLKKAPPPDSHQERVLRLAIARPFGEPAEVEALSKRLLADQNEDGGWSQAPGLPSDALATGQALFALSSAPAATRTLEASG